MMKILALVLVLAAPGALRDDKETVEKAVAKIASQDSYAFKGETEFQSQFGNAPAQIPSMDGKYQKDVGMHIKTERGEFFRKGERVLVKQGEGEWSDVSQLKPPTPSPDAPPKKRAARGGLGFAQIMIRNFKAPHDELKELARTFKEVKKQEKTEKIGDVECTVYGGDLSEEAMKGSQLGRMLGMFGGANADVKGSGRVWIDGNGTLMVYEVTTKATVELQGNQIDFSLIRRAELSELGKVKVEIPEAVQKLLGEKPKTEDKKE
jgi:hypothetical protein